MAWARNSEIFVFQSRRHQINCQVDIQRTFDGHMSDIFSYIDINR